jgi:hypothetical protein
MTTGAAMMIKRNNYQNSTKFLKKAYVAGLPVPGAGCPVSAGDGYSFRQANSILLIYSFFILKGQ